MIRLAPLALLAACWRGDPPPETPVVRDAAPVRAEDHDDTSMHAAVRVVGAFAERMCACVDKACADEVQAEFVTWGEKITAARHHATERRVDEESLMQVNEIAMRYGECLARVMSGGTVSP